MDCVLALLQSDSAPSWENPITTGFCAGEVSAGTISLFFPQPVRREAAASRQIPAFKILLCKRISFVRLSVNLYMPIIPDSPGSENKKEATARRVFPSIRQKDTCLCSHLCCMFPYSAFSAFFFLAITTLCTTRKRQSIAAMVIPVHHAWSRPAEDTIF